MKRYLMGAHVFGVLLGLTARTASPAEDAAGAKKAGHFPQANALFGQALALDPANLTLLGQRGTVQGWTG